MTNLKKMMAALTAAMCMTAMMPVSVIAEGTAVLDHDSYVVIAINYAEGTDEAESYVLLNTPQWQYVITAEDMGCYLTEDSAQPKIGDVLKVECDEGDNLSGKGMYDILFGFVFSEGDTITNYGSADEYLSAPRNYVLLREYEGQYLLQDVQTIAPRERAGEYLMMRLRTVGGVIPEEYEKQFLLPFNRLEEKLTEYMNLDYVIRTYDGRWHLTPQGFLISNTIISELLLIQDEYT